MTANDPAFTRRHAIAAALAAAGALAAPGAAARAAAAAQATAAGSPAARASDWEWHAGRWNVRHRRLKERLKNGKDWEEFDGTSELWLRLGGVATVDENVLKAPGGTYRGMGIHIFDAASGDWLIYWVDERSPGVLGAPVRGRFADGAGTFLADETFEGRPIKVRHRFTDIHESPRWEQAFSADGGRSWEVNWIARYTRAG